MKCLLVLLFGVATLSAQTGEQLRFVVIMSRHGVRSPTAKAEQLNPYSAQPWPKWSVPPGYLTEHGTKLLNLMGAYDRSLFAQQGLLTPSGCEDAHHIAVVADSDQRTRETGRALAAGMFPGCSITTQALPEGTNDPLFHPLKQGRGSGDRELATAAVSGRIGANPNAVMELYRPQLETMEEVLRGCKSTPCEPKPDGGRVSLFTLPTALRPGSGDHLVDFRSPLSTGSTFAENMLLEYTDGMDESQVGWGHVDGKKLRRLIELHTAQVDLVDRTPFIARAQASNILQHVLASMQQAATQKAAAGALGRAGDRLLILSGHDTNIASIAGALNLSWLVDGRLNDTPPGGALVFELWSRAGAYSVRAFYMCQTLEQMRFATPLTLTAPAERVAVFVPGCGKADGSCSWSDFQNTVRASINPAYVP